MQDLLQAGERLCARGGCGRAAAEEARGRRSCCRSDLRRDQGQCREPRRTCSFADGAQSACAGRPDQDRASASRHRPAQRGLHRGPRYRHRIGRPDRIQWAEERLRRPLRGQRRCGRGGASLRRRIGQEQHRASRIGGRHRRRHQGAAAASPQDAGAESAQRRDQPLHPAGRQPVLCRAGAPALAGADRRAGPRAAAACRRQRLRLRRRQRPHRAGRVPGRQPRAAAPGAGRRPLHRRVVGAHAPAVARRRRTPAEGDRGPRARRARHRRGRPGRPGLHAADRTSADGGAAGPGRAFDGRTDNPAAGCRGRHRRHRGHPGHPPQRGQAEP